MDENITMIDVERDLWCFNVGTVVPSGTKLRQWKACREYGFVSAGQTELDVLYAKKLKAKDVICAYESGTGFIAIGKVLKYPLPITQFKLPGQRTLRNLPYVNMGTINDHGLFENEGNDKICEHLALIQWYELTAEPLKINKKDYGYYAPRNTTAFLKERNGPEQNFKRDAIEVIKRHFKVSFNFFD